MKFKYRVYVYSNDQCKKFDFKSYSDAAATFVLYEDNEDVESVEIVKIETNEVVRVWSKLVSLL